MKNTEKTLKSLEDTLQYKNDNVIYGFMEKFEVAYEEATDIFNEVKRWLWLCAKTSQETINQKRLYINSDLRILDQMWHTFILFTNDYSNFCKKYLGKFIPHSPTTYKEKLHFQKKVEENDTAFLERNNTREKELHELIYDAFGREILRKWFLEYPVKYSTENIKKLYKGIY